MIHRHHHSWKVGQGEGDESAKQRSKRVRDMIKASP